jgi:protein gp37
VSEKTGISWTDHTFNPWWGCMKVSAGCANCYAETWSKFTGFDIWGPAATTPRRFFDDRHWREPLKWNATAEAEGRRHRVFCASMADVFEDHPEVGPHRMRLFELVEATPYLDWQLLTKRPENVGGMIPEHWLTAPPLNWWQGTSVENNDVANPRLFQLAATAAMTKFVSFEPLLGRVDAMPYLTTFCSRDEGQCDWLNHRRRCEGCAIPPENMAFQWAILGGESGPGYRPMELEWLTDLVEQCQAAGVAVFVKQDSSPKPGRQGRIPDEIFGLEQFPTPVQQLAAV